MHKMTKRFILPLLLLALAIPTFAQKGPAKDGSGLGRGDKLQALELTAEQEDQMKDLRYAKEKILIQLRADLKTSQLELKKLKQADEPNKKKIYAQIDKVGKQRTAIEKARVDHQLKIRKVLTDEQFKMFQKKMQAKAGRGDQRKSGSRRDRGESRRPFRK